LYDGNRAEESGLPPNCPIVDEFERVIMCSVCSFAQALAPQIRARKISRGGFVASGLAAGATLAAAGARNALASSGPADVVFVNGKVYTMNPAQPWAQAVVVRGKHIAYVGDSGAAKTYAGTKTEIVDLRGKMLLPGFVEAHTHPFTGSALSQGVDLQYDTREKLLQVLSAYAKTNPAGGLVRGFGWRYIAFPPTGPRKEDLDAIWPDKPVFLCAIDIHCAWVNSKALQLAGITKDTPDPVPGFSRFERDPGTGEPTGYLIEPPAMVKVLEASEPFTLDSVAASLKQWLPKASAAGITSVMDAGVIVVDEDEAYGHYVELERAGALPMRVVGTHYYNDPKVDPIPIIASLRAKYDTELVRASILKLNIDGGPEPYTAYMLEPYSDKPDTRGVTLIAPERIKEIVLAADRAGIDVHCHVIGDGAVRLTLDAIEAAIAANPARNRRHALAHLPLVSEADLPRFAKLGVIAQSSAQWAVLDPAMVDITGKRWGNRADNLFRYGSFVRSGARFALGADWPAASYYSTYKPLDAIEVALTRQEIGNPNAQMLPRIGERLELDQALHANTLGAAYQLRLDDVAGSIEVGKLADLAVLQENLFNVPVREIHATPVAMTMMNGTFTHRTNA
jgi:predicted amidohydrolase YtcJ